MFVAASSPIQGFPGTNLSKSDQVTSGGTGIIKDSLAGDGRGISPIKGFGYDSLDNRVRTRKGQTVLCITGEKL